MKSRLHPTFRRRFAALPEEIKVRARAAYARFKENPSHPGLAFKKVSPNADVWSVRVSDNYRAVGVMDSNGDMLWFFIGTHAEYDRLLANL